MVFNNINNQFFFVSLAARLRSNQKSEFLAMRILQNKTGDDGRTNKTGMDLEHQKTWRCNDVTVA